MLVPVYVSDLGMYEFQCCLGLCCFEPIRRVRRPGRSREHSECHNLLVNEVPADFAVTTDKKQVSRNTFCCSPNWPYSIFCCCLDVRDTRLIGKEVR